MNDTYRILTKSAKKKRTQELVELVDKVTDGHKIPDVMSALVQVLITLHLNTCVTKKGKICNTCANAELTKLFQAMREINDEFMESIPKVKRCK